MPVSIPDFWNLVVESRLLAPDVCQQLAVTFEQTKGSIGQASAKSLAEWLISINVLSKYQATVLANGRSGPFFYGEYKVYDRIETGRWKGLFRAVHAPTNHPVLLQFITGAVTQDPQHWAYVLGQVHNRLTASYPHWHRYHEVIDLGNFKFLVAEDLAGDSLDQRLATMGRVAPQDACIIVRHVALALAQIHRWQMPHGDVRPANIWLDAHGHARLLQDPTLIPRPLASGTGDPEGLLAERADYAAPELQQPGKVPDAQTDIYALGCCFYHMITGQPPFAGGDVAAKLQRHSTEPIQPLAQFGVPEPLAKIIAFMMAKNPQVRFPQAQLVADQLASFIDPARLNVASMSVVPTLPVYEQFLQQRGLGRTTPAFLSSPSPVVPMSATSAALPAPPPSPVSPMVAVAPASPGVVAAPSSPATVSPSAANPSSSTPSTPTRRERSKSVESGEAEGRMPAGTAVAKSVTPASASGPTTKPTAKPTTKTAATTAATTGTTKPPGSTSAGLSSPTPPPVVSPASRPTAGGAGPIARPVPVTRPTGSPGGVPVGTADTRASGTDTAQRVRAASEESKQKILVVGSLLAAVALVLIVVLVIVMGGGSGEQPVEVADGVVGTGAGSTGTGSTGTGSTGTGSSTAGTGGPGAGSVAGGGPAGSVPNATPGAIPDASGKKKTWDLGKGATGTGVTTESGSSSEFVQQVVPDDGMSLWESPTTGAPVAFEWVPPGAQVFLIVRPSDFLNSPEGPRVVQALGPALSKALMELERIASLKMTDIEQLIVTLHDNGEDFPRPAMVVRAKEPLDLESLVDQWKGELSGETARARVFRAGAWSYGVPKEEGNRVFLIGAEEEVKEVADTGGAPPALRREMEKLRRLTDDQRHVTLLLAPNYLSSTMFRDGRSFYFGEPRKLREPLDWFLRDELQAVLLSLHVESDTYLEMRLSSNFNKDRYQLAEEFRDRLELVPDLAFDFIATLGSNPYWERVRLQYPNMIRFLHAKTRIGVEEDTATINARLPEAAAHNLLFGSEMVLSSTPGAIAIAAKPAGPMNATTGGMPPSIMTVEDVVAKYKTTMEFEAQSLEFALQDIARDVNETLKGLPYEFKIKIMGDDLKLDGITRNQTVRDFSQRDKSVGEVLTAMVMKANPVTTVKEPNELDQKLLWVIEKDPEDPSKLVVLITTRQISEQKKYKLPAVFQPK